MNKLFIVIVCCIVSFSSIQAQIDIADARDTSEGSTVTIEGVVTNGDELGIIRYIQDDTGAIPAYPGSGSIADFPENVKRGDLLQVTGILKEYNGLLEIDPIQSFTVISSDNTLPDPLVVTPNEINEANEAKLLKANGITFTAGGSVFTVGNFSFSANGESSEIYIRSNHPLIGTAIPLATVNLTGISSQFNSIYQLLPRDANDIEIADNFFFTSSPVQSDITNSGFTLSWETNVPGTTALRYGTTPDMSNEINEGGSTTTHSLSLSELDPAEFYYVQVFSDNGSTTIDAVTSYYSTASNSTGSIHVYFNHHVNGSFSDGSYPAGTSPAALEAAIINRINSASTSIDVSVYNNNRPTIVQALTNAYNNGVQVRYITDDDTQNLALDNPTPPFPVIRGNTEGLMHNKFFVFDPDSENDSWVIMGSTNLTPNNLAEDFNNMVIIQDQAIARAYTIEFEEMWGSDGASPGIFSLKFGAEKINNTPHLFNVNGVMVESRFSPSDNTTIAISRAIQSADVDLQFATLTFTNNELGSAVLNAHNAGVSVRGIIDNTGDQGTEYTYLTENDVNVSPDNNALQTHHKYCVIDATDTTSDPIVVTGSHNWSASAETRNDENTLIFHDATIANIFLQEFEARWCEATGGSDCITSLRESEEIDGFEVKLFPNPAVDISNIHMTLDDRKDLTISLWSFTGQLLQSNILRDVQGQRTETLYLNGLPAGSYIVTFTLEDQITVRKVEVVR